MQTTDSNSRPEAAATTYGIYHHIPAAIPTFSTAVAETAPSCLTATSASSCALTAKEAPVAAASAVVLVVRILHAAAPYDSARVEFNLLLQPFVWQHLR